MFRISFIFIIFVSCFSLTSGQQIFLDEVFDDWKSGVTTFTDKKGDGNALGIDITDVKISNDESNLYLYVDIKKELNIQSSNNLTVYIDIDNKTTTGLSKNGIGADISYNFGDRQGLYYGSFNTDLYHDDLGLVTLPTVTSDKFEMSILRKFTRGSTKISMGNVIKVLFSDESFGGDLAPDAGATIMYTFNPNIKALIKPYSFKKLNPEDLRVMCYNVLKDNLFESSTRDAYSRIFKAINPDIIGLVEIYDNSALATANLIESFLPSIGSQKWYYDGVSPDVIIVSRYPIINKRSSNGNGIFLVDLGTSKLVYIVAHLPCCDNEIGRQDEVDNIMSFVRDIRYGISAFQVPQNTPIVIVGDMNLVGLRAQQHTFITGDIINNNLYGPDFLPDWDDSSLEDAKPATTNVPSTFTWNSPGGSYSAGRLDYVLYTGSVIYLKNSFALWSPALTNSELSTTGLQSGDMAIASDHLPVVCDFGLIASSLTEHSNKEDYNVQFNRDEVTIYYKNPGPIEVLITISDIMGRVYFQQKSSNLESLINLEQLVQRGVYILNIRNQKGSKSIKFVK
ncbi:MAG: T9SS type A sorting domain-containing protein [Saprospiraceae bacterium]|nr:T9SS type A sorting domain-containing protein [Saprospiraceae bacterium]